MLNPLPPDPQIHIDGELLFSLSRADNALTRLDGALSLFSEDDYILSLLRLAEAIESSNIDGTKFSLTSYFTNLVFIELEKNIIIDNSLSAIQLGHRLIKDVSSASHILRSIHKELYKDLNSQDSGEFRKTNTFMGESEKIKSAKYFAPSPEEVPTHINSLESYISSNVSYQVLVNTALIHSRFEMIHPFLSGNGLIGRMLIHLNLIWKKKSINSSLQISRVFRSKRLEYFDRIEDIEKNNNWLGWIKFFVRAVNDASIITLNAIKQIQSLKRKLYKKNISDVLNSSISFQVFEYIFNKPGFTSTSIINDLSLTKQTASIIINKFFERSFFEEITGQQRNRVYVNKKLLDILE